MRALCAGVAILLASMTARGQTPATQASSPSTQPSPQQVAALIQAMGQDQYQARQKAQDDLIDLGPAVEPALRQAVADSTSPEIRSRAAAAILQIEDRIADAPTFITLHAAGANPADVCAQISRQAHIGISGWPPWVWNGGAPGRASPVSLDVDQMPFWLAMQKFCDATHTEPGNVGNDVDSITLMPHGGNGAGNAPWDQEGLFSIIAQQIVHNREVDLASGNSTKNDFVQIIVYADPKVRILKYTVPQLLQAVDDLGNSMVSSATMNSFSSDPFRSWSIQCDLPLQFPQHFGSKLSVIEGTIVVQVPAHTELLRIPDLSRAGNAVFSAGGRKVEVESFSSLPDGSIRLRARVSNLSATIAPPRMGLVPMGMGLQMQPNLFEEFRQARMIDAAGKSLPIIGGGSGSMTSIEYDATISPPMDRTPLKAPFSLEWKVVTEIKTETIHFKFKDLPLPPD